MPSAEQKSAHEIIRNAINEIRQEFMPVFEEDSEMVDMVISSALMATAEKMLVDMHGTLHTSEMLYAAADDMQTRHAVEILERDERDED